INPAIAQDSRTFEAEALLGNLDGRLKPGFFVQASIPSEKEEKTIFLPEGAVNYRYGVYKVFLLNGDHVAERQIRPAGQTEDERGRRFEVAEGLKPGDRVAVAVSGELHDGAVVQFTGHRHGNAISRFQAFGDFKPPAALVFRLPCRADLPLSHVIAV